MPNEHRYNQQEIAAIFERAAQTQAERQEKTRPGEGLTLAELQQAGQEVGLSPEAVAAAAQSVLLEQRASTAAGTYGGVPHRVARTVDLPGTSFSEADWELLVVDLRETFQAKGETQRDGSFRQWTNGNLQVLIEPTDTGSQLRMQTTSAKVIENVMVSWMVGGTAAFLATLFAINANDVSWVFGMMLVLSFGLGLALWMRAHRKGVRWSAERAEQMARLADRAVALAADDTQERRAAARAAERSLQLDLDASAGVASEGTHPVGTRTRA